MYSIIRSRAGLVALVFALISISLVSALPISFPAAQSGLSSPLSLSPNNPSHDGQNLIQHDTRRIPKFSVNASGQMSGAPAATRALSGKYNPMDTDDDQLVRRNVFSKIKHAFQSLGHKIKSGFQKLGQDIKHVAQKIGSGIKKVAQKVGSGIKKVAQKIGSGIKRVAQKVGAGIKKVAKKIGSGIKTAAKKVWHFMKTTGAKIVKFGLKVVQTVGTAVAKVVSFIPDVGKPLERAIDGVAKGAGMISDKIHVKLPPKLQKTVNGMDKADKYMEYIPRRRDLSDEEAFQQRDISDKYYFESDSDDISLASEHLYLDEESYVDDDYEHSEHWE
jgi:hypothetical protein